MLLLEPYAWKLFNNLAGGDPCPGHPSDPECSQRTLARDSLRDPRSKDRDFKDFVFLLLLSAARTSTSTSTSADPGKLSPVFIILSEADRADDFGKRRRTRIGDAARCCLLLRSFAI